MRQINLKKLDIIGAFPWIARIGYTNPDGSVNFRCGKIVIHIFNE